MTYTLKLFDTALLRFKVIENLADPVLRITWMTDTDRHLLPLGMTADEEGLCRWIKHRVIPKNRAFANIFLARCGLNANRPMDVIAVCKGLSLNDSYWISDENETKSFDQVNLYENRFSKVLASIAFTGYGSSVRSSFASSPEFTTNGMLPKCWRRVDGKIYLYKGATSGASNTGWEPYSEKYAYLAGRRPCLTTAMRCLTLPGRKTGSRKRRWRNMRPPCCLVSTKITLRRQRACWMPLSPKSSGRRLPSVSGMKESCGIRRRESL